MNYLKTGFDHLDQLVIWFTPARAVHDERQLSTNRLLVSISLITSAFSLLYVGISFVIGFDIGVILMLACFILLFAILFLFRASGLFRLSANLYLGCCFFVAILGCSFFSGGFHSSVFPWFALIPIAGILLLGYSRDTILWFLLCCVVTLIYGLLAMLGFQFPERYQLEFANFFHTICIVGLVMIMFLIALAFDSNRNLALKKILEQNDSLRIARNLAEAATKVKSEFIANMSHEIRTPMNSILGMAHLALTTEVPAKKTNYLEKIHLSGLHLLGIIEEILDFSKITAGKLEVENTDFDLGDMLESTKVLFEERIKEKGLDFAVNIDPELPACLRGDPLRLGQVLINYINNAIKFTEKGRVIVSIKKMDENERGVLVRFEVQDTGIGIDDPAKSKLFQPFQQADTTTTREYGGTGLGLAISKQLVELMKEGKIGVESALGKGSIFWFSVRLCKGCMRREVTQESAKDLQSSELAIFNEKHILVVEDHPLNQEVITDILEKVGAVICIAQNGKEAIDLLAQKHFDCILMDVQMPVMDGYETTRLIRANPALAKIPIFALTANASNSDHERCLASGMDDFISKPFNPTMFYATIAHWFMGSVKHKSLPTTASIPDSGTALKGDTDAIDLSVLAELVGGNKREMRELASRFLASSRKDVKEIEAALELKDFMALCALGHRAGSPAGILGANGFAKLCRALEDYCKSGCDVTQTQEIISQMHAMLNQINEITENELM